MMAGDNYDRTFEVKIKQNPFEPLWSDVHTKSLMKTSYREAIVPEIPSVAFMSIQRIISSTYVS